MQIRLVKKEMGMLNAAERKMCTVLQLQFNEKQTHFTCIFRDKSQVLLLLLLFSFCGIRFTVVSCDFIQSSETPTVL